MTTRAKIWTGKIEANGKTTEYQFGSGDEGLYAAAEMAAHWLVAVEKGVCKWQQDIYYWAFSANIYCNGDTMFDYYKDSEKGFHTNIWLQQPIAASFGMQMREYEWYYNISADFNEIQKISFEEMNEMRESGGSFVKASIYELGECADYAWWLNDNLYEVTTTTQQQTELLIQAYFSDAAEQMLIESKERTVVVDGIKKWKIVQ